MLFLSSAPTQVCYLGQVLSVVSELLLVLLQFSRHHLPGAEVEARQVHGVSKVTGQLRLTAELLPCRTEGGKRSVTGWF